MIKTLFLLYHDLDSAEYPSEKEDLATKETVVRLSEFESHMAALAENGWHVISMSHFFAKQNQGSVTDKDIVLTFDDGHISNHRLAFPVLQKYGFKATFFIIAERIGASYYMDNADLQELSGAGMEIGSHGLTHTYLPELSSPGIESELAESKTIIESVVEQPVETFAYPGGHYNSNVLKCIKKSGYKAGASCIVGWNSRKTNPLLLRRVEIRRGTTAADFKCSINANNVLFYQAIDNVKSGMKKIVGLERYKFLRQKLYFLYPFKR